MSGRDIRVHVPALTRVEGEGALHLEVSEGRIERLQLSIFEPPRYFEKFLEGRDYHEVPDIVARICGICPVAYQMSAMQALEQAFGIQPAPWVAALRRAMYCGEWIQSHALHIHLLAAPDFLGYDSAIGMAERYPDEVRRGLALQGLGNELMTLLGGRAVHPVAMCVGGFHQAPAPARVDALLRRLRAALPDAEALIAWTASLPLPTHAQRFVSVALRNDEEYPMNAGRIVSDAGLDIAPTDYAAHFEESHAPHSTALYSHLHGEPYLVGPMARLNLNLDRLPESARLALSRTGIEFPSGNLFHSIVARAVELYIAMLEAVRLLEHYRLPEQPRTQVEPCAGVGFGATEAPRGLLWHRYEVDARGLIVSATIVPPTSQNQARIERDLHETLTEYGLDHSDDELRLRCEMVVRNYDPCISCATHFLDLRIERT
ncbi:MAG: Ni/Fe hydrogenase subunit alpha [Thiotrichales bacterium]